MIKKTFVLVILSLSITTAQWKAEGIAVADSDDNVNRNYFPGVVTDGRGGCYISWMDFRNRTDLNIFTQRLDSNGREVFPHNGIAVVTASGTQVLNLCTADGRGGIFFTWVDERDAVHSYIYAQHMDSSGNTLWQTNGVKVSEREGLGAQVITDGVGGIIVNYTRVFGVVMQRLDSAGNRMWGDSGISQSNNEIFVYEWYNAMDGKGGVIVSWIQENGIYAQRIRYDGSVAWKQNGIRVSTIDTVRSIISMIGDGASGAMITWTTGSNVEVRAQRVDSTGTLLWGTNGVHIGYGGTLTGEVVSDPKRGAIIPVLNKLYRVNSDGTHIWPGGITYTNSVGPMRVVSDSASGAVVIYEGPHNPPLANWDEMYAQRIDSSGNVRWKSGGVVIANYYLAYRDKPAAVSDGKGGVIGAWDEYRWLGDTTNALVGIYAGKVDSQGSVVTSVDLLNHIVPPREIELFQNFPNPFNPETIISYHLSVFSNVKLTVFDLLGREVATLVDGVEESGYKSVQWDASGVSTGMYFYRLQARPTEGGQAGDFVQTKKLLLLR